MQVTVTGKQIEIGNALRTHIDAILDGMLTKYFKTGIEAHVVLAKEAHLVRAEVSVHIGRGIVVNASAALHDPAAAYDAAAERVAKQLRRYKRRLRDHHAKLRDSGEPVERARDYVLAPVDEDEGDEQHPAQHQDQQPNAGAPAVIAEISTQVPRLTVSEAVMRMDLADVPVLLFRNEAHGELNLVYRRTDGNIGWVDPVLDPARRERHDAGSRRGG
jgi:ribosomal subunit interface protein